MASRKWTVLRRAAVAFLFLFPIFAGCSSLKRYQLRPGPPNLSVQVHMEGAGLFESKVAGLSVYEVRNTCEWFNYGLIELNQGENRISLPVGNLLVIEYARVNATFDHRAESSHTVRFRPREGVSYRLTSRERAGSREVLFFAKDSATGKLREYAGESMPKCEQLKVEE